MRHISLITVAGLVTLGLGGCGLFGGGDTPTTTAESPPVVSVPVESPSAVPVPSQSPAQPFGAAPTAPQQAPPQGNLPPDLISSTDPDERVREVQRNRADPFALLPTTPVVQLPEQPEPQPAPAPVQSPENDELAPLPDVVPSLPAPPPIPQPTLARAVEVTGIVQVGTTPYVIVSAPNEPFSRYVRTGQFLSNGEVLVKQIVMNQGAEPFVVLEENGIEVVRAVGEGGPPTPEEGVPTAIAISSTPAS